MSARIAFAVILLLAGCGSAANRAKPSAATASRTQRCTERFLQQAKDRDSSSDVVRRYIETTYCAPFEKHGWVYDDGTLSIGAQRWLESGTASSCEAGAGGEPTRTVPCEDLYRGEPQMLDCAILHQVRRSEVRKYVEGLRRSRKVLCDDGTPLEKLGAG